ncbi:DUF1800 domain-containing protein [Cryomorphaceae bacterium 1068]|nr:DUF1800 domain-containing protein [Cryomorphaceae bacterium 1068]
MNSLKELKHYHSRFGFGLSLKDLLLFKESNSFDAHKNLEKQMDSRDFSPLEISRKLKPIRFKEMVGMEKSDRKAMIDADRKLVIEINGEWIAKMANTSNPLREKMSLFWHDHFACKPKTSYMTSSYLELIRKESLGNFRSLLHGIAKEPAMLLYLNNQQNRKGHPNENFAREVMELFTLGIGNYSEKDIKESARAFTGWNVDSDRHFKLNERQHDNGTKTFFGETKRWTGEEVIDRILEEKAAAEYVSGKIAKYFLGRPPSENLQSTLTRTFYESDYEIGPVLLAIAESDEFNSEDIIGQDVLSPVELLVRLERDFHLSADDNFYRIAIQKGLGQVLFQPPNVAGWPSGKGWIDASTLPTRLSLARAILLKNDYEVKTNKSFAQGEDLTENLSKRLKKGLQAKSNISAIEEAFGHMSYSDKTTQIANWLIPETVLNENEMIEEIKLLGFEGTKGALALIASLPEYQLK